MNTWPFTASWSQLTLRPAVCAWTATTSGNGASRRVSTPSGRCGHGRYCGDGCTVEFSNNSRFLTSRSRGRVRAVPPALVSGLAPGVARRRWVGLCATHARGMGNFVDFGTQLSSTGMTVHDLGTVRSIVRYGS